MPRNITHPESSLTIDRTTLEKLRDHAAFAAHLVGHLDDNPPPELVRQLGDRIDTIAHELTEILGEARTLAEHDAAAPDVVHDGAPMLALDAGGAP